MCDGLYLILCPWEGIENVEEEGKKQDLFDFWFLFIESLSTDIHLW